MSLARFIQRSTLVSCVIAAAACSRNPRHDETGKTRTPTVAAPHGSSVPPDPAPPRLEPTPLLELDVAAYAATLAVDDEAVYLLTSTAAYRLIPGEDPLRMPLDLGSGPVVMRSAIAFWSKGSIWQAPKRGGKPILLGVVPHRPQFLTTSGTDLAFLDRSADGRFTIRTLDGKKARTVYVATGDIVAMTMIQDWVFFVERAGNSSWRIGAAPLSGKPPTFTQPKTDRTPSMLAASNDVFYYDGPSLTVRRLSPDFNREDVFARNFICSPIAASERVFCAQVDGLFELSARGEHPVQLAGSQTGPITSIAASPNRVAWVVDAGPNKLAVETLPLSRAGATR